MRFLRSFCVFALLIILSMNAYASDAHLKEVKTLSLKSDFGTASDWHVTAWQSTDKDFAIDDIPAKLCFWISRDDQEKNCTSITSTLPDEGIAYRYQTVQELIVVHPDAANPSAVLLKFTARFFGGGSGFLDQVSFWNYDKQVNAFELSSHITLTEQGECRLFDKGTLTGLLVTADAILQAGETHFSPHHFYVEAYRYKKNTGYAKVLGYLTRAKYPSFDDAEKIDVITPEISRIESLLKAIGE